MVGSGRGGAVRGETGFANITSLMALAVSLVSAGWSVFAFVMASEVRVLPFTEINVFSESGVPQIKIDATLANLAYGNFDDVARSQELVLRTPKATLRFEVKRQSRLSLLPLNADQSYAAAPPDCYVGGRGLAVCPVSDVPVLSLPSGQIVTASPVFELAETACGLADCAGATLAQISPMLEGAVAVSYRVDTLRDGVRAYDCTVTISHADMTYLADVGWANPRCVGAAKKGVT